MSPQAEALRALAETAAGLGDFAAADPLLEAAAHVDPEHAGGLFRLAAARFALFEAYVVEGDPERFAGAPPGAAPRAPNRGALRSLDDAVFYARAALALDPAIPRAAAMLAHFEAARGALPDGAAADDAPRKKKKRRSAGRGSGEM